jgi:hypothetical protein
MLLTPAVVGLVAAWWAVLQTRVVQIRHRPGGAAACRQPSRPPRHRRPAVTLIAPSCSDRAALHRPLGSPQPAQLRRQRPGALLQILQVVAAVERPPVAAAGPAAPIAGLGGARRGVVGLGPAGTGVALAEPRAGRDGDLPGPVGLPAAHQLSPPLAWLPGSDQPTHRAGTARSEPHRRSTVPPPGRHEPTHNWLVPDSTRWTRGCSSVGQSRRLITAGWQVRGLPAHRRSADP